MKSIGAHFSIISLQKHNLPTKIPQKTSRIPYEERGFRRNRPDLAESAGGSVGRRRECWRIEEWGIGDGFDRNCKIAEFMIQYIYSGFQVFGD